MCWVRSCSFLASAAASSAHLTVSEVFPLEMRALAISLFYAVGTGAGGFVAPLLFGALIEAGSRDAVAAGYAIGAVRVIAAGLIAWRFGFDAERRSLKDIAPPLGAAAEPQRGGRHRRAALRRRNPAAPAKHEARLHSTGR